MRSKKPNRIGAHFLLRKKMVEWCKYRKYMVVYGPIDFWVSRYLFMEAYIPFIICIVKVPIHPYGR